MSNPYEPSNVPAERQPQESSGPEPGAVAYGVFVRSLGLFAVCYGVWTLLLSFSYAIGVPEAQHGDTAASLFSGVFLVVIGAILLSAARFIVAGSYPRS